MKSPSILLSIVAAVTMTLGLSTSTVHAQECSADVNQDYNVDGLDLAILLTAWGTSGGSVGADINNDGTVNGEDVVHVLAGWGDCDPITPHIPTGGALVKIDISALDQTDLSPAASIYMVGFASASGKVLQQDPTTKLITIEAPKARDFTLESTYATVGLNTATFDVTTARPNLFVGGDVVFIHGPNGNCYGSKIKSISAHVVGLVDTAGSIAAGYPGTGTSGTNIMLSQPGAIFNAGGIINIGGGSNILGNSVPISSTGVRLGSLLMGQSTEGAPAGGGGIIPPTGSAVVANSQVTGFDHSFAPGNVHWQNPPIADFPTQGQPPITDTATGICAIGSDGYLTGALAMTNNGAGYGATINYPASFTPATQDKWSFYPCDNASAGQVSHFPGQTSQNVANPLPTFARNAASVTCLTTTTGGTSIDISKNTVPPTWATPFSTLDAATTVDVFSGGMNNYGFATLAPLATITLTKVNNITQYAITDINPLITFTDTTSPIGVVVWAPGMIGPGLPGMQVTIGTATVDGNGHLQGFRNWAGPRGEAVWSHYNIPTGPTGAKFGIYAMPPEGGSGWGTRPSYTINDLMSTSDIQDYDLINRTHGTSIRIDGVPNANADPAPYGIRNVVSYTITFTNNVPVDTTKFVFSNHVAATVLSANELQIDTSHLYPAHLAYPGIVSALALGIIPSVSDATTPTCPIPALNNTHTASRITKLDLNTTGDRVIITLADPLSTHFHVNDPVFVSLPPTGGTLEAIEWVGGVGNSATKEIWATQLQGEKNSVDGARIYFFMNYDRGDGTPPFPRPAFPYNMSTATSADIPPITSTVVSVTQPPESLLWEGKISPYVYLEMTANGMACVEPANCTNGAQRVYIDLSAVDGFFFPAALETVTCEAPHDQNIVMGQPYESFTQNGTPYGAVTRAAVLTNWTTFFSNSSNFATDPDSVLLGHQYGELSRLDPHLHHVGISNPTFAYAFSTVAIPPFDNCWEAELESLFGLNSHPIHMKGDLTWPPPPFAGPTYPTYYWGEASMYPAAGGAVPAIEFDEYIDTRATPPGGYVPPDSYADLCATGVKFRVFDPRKPPPSETAAYVLDQAGPTKMTAGYQVFANAGVFASSKITTDNYLPGTLPTCQDASTGWVDADKLKQLNAIQRDLVVALSHGVAARGSASSFQSPTPNKPNSTWMYWSNQSYWYPYNAPYGAATPQNLFAQWVHTAHITSSAGTFPYATYPMGDISPGPGCQQLLFGSPVQCWGGALTGGSPGTGPFMNQTYGFAYDETPPSPSATKTNVPSKILDFPNEVGQTITYKLVFGPWGKTP